MTGDALTSIAIIRLYLLIYFLTPALAQTSTVNGRAEYQGTAVATNPHGIPTLVYNCAKLPAICSNVNQRNPLEVQSPGRPGQYGKLRSVSYIEMNYDTDTQRKDGRRDSVCPCKWSSTHTCPETNQPPTVPGGSSYSSGSFAAARLIQPNVQKGDVGYNTIANAAGIVSGMVWSCDEWPPASTVEGGAGQANTYCAPQRGSILGKSWTWPISVRSEQDLQGTAHTVLRNRVAGNTNPSGIFTFHFRTEWKDEPDVPAAMVEWYDSDGEYLDAYQKRSIEPTHFVVDTIHANRTVKSERYRLSHRSASSQHGAGNGTAVTPPVQQPFNLLPEAPPLPIIEISRSLIQAQAGVPVLSYTERMRKPVLNNTINVPSMLTKRQTIGKCGRGNPCPDGSCCSVKGNCGYGLENCGAGNCTLNCDATALCGKDSKGGITKCPLNVCCSSYGYCGTGDEFCSSSQPNAPCQKGFGSCQTVSAPSCGGSSSSARSIGYYQVDNTRSRQCNRITPAQINISGLTHLNLAFATIDPSGFKVVPANPADVEIYRQFTSLKSSSLQTWIAIGGWAFNDPGPTQTAFSDLASSSSNRALFISSLLSFMDKHGFQGVDLDWEYPGAPDRSGKQADTDNYVLLLREMRAAFGSKYGISVAIPSSYWYLRWFKPKEMEPYVDYFGLMSYDLHGSWDADVKNIGKVVYGQTNIPEIANWTLPLWYDGLDPAKINFGLAYYGRGYTLADPSCNRAGCSWSGPSRPGPCTNFGGVMSLQEIENLVPQLGLQPQLLPNDMMKQLSWSDQWIGYDDMETIAMKKQWASQRCFGGTMIWSIDLYSGSGSGDTPDGLGSDDPGSPGAGGGQSGASEGGAGSLVYIDPSVWKELNPLIECQPPCTFVLPPLVLPKPTTISFPPYVTSLDVAWSEPTGWTSIVQRTTLTIPPVVTTAIDVWQHTVTDSKTVSQAESSFYATPSILPPPFVITNDPNPRSSPGVSHSPVTRTITPPPYPYKFTTPRSKGAVPTSQPAPPGEEDDNDDDDDIGISLPVVTYRPGPPGPKCRSGCGKRCLIFCNSPCLLNCIDGGNDFVDPSNPNPRRANPRKPFPSGKPFPGDDPEAEEEKEEEEEEEEEKERSCQSEPTKEPNEPKDIEPPPPPPAPKPPPDPEPPSPNRDTESVDCYNSGALVGRGDSIKAVNDFCSRFAGVVLDDSRSDGERTLEKTYGGVCAGALGCFDEVDVSVTVINGCRFKMDENECGRILRRPVDECDTSSTRFKQGGTVNGNCALWVFDPNLDW